MEFNQSIFNYIFASGFFIIVAAILIWIENSTYDLKDLDRYKDYYKAKKELKKNYFKDREEANHAGNAYLSYVVNKIVRIGIVIGFIFVFTSVLYGFLSIYVF
jgi:hypothetical protein